MLRSIVCNWTCSVKDAYLTIPPCSPLLTEPPNLLSWSTTQPNAVSVPSTWTLHHSIFFFKSLQPSFLHHFGIHLTIYLLLATPIKEQLTSLGSVINIPKSITTSTCHLEFSRISIEHTFFLPVYKMHSIQKEVSQFIGESLNKGPSFWMGMLVATKPTLWIGPLHYVALQDMNIQSLCLHPSYQSSVNLSREGTSRSLVVAVRLSSHCSGPMLRLKVIESDVSK